MEAGGPRGYDAAKKVTGRKRHIAVDTQALLLGVIVHAASIQDADGASSLVGRIKPLYCWLRAVFADSAYNRVPAILASFLLGLVLLIVSRPWAGLFNATGWAALRPPCCIQGAK